MKHAAETKERARALYLQGAPWYWILDELCISGWALSTWTRDLPRRYHRPRPKTKRRTELPPSVKAEALDLSRRGLKAPRIARYLGLNRRTVHSWIRAATLSP